MKDFVRNTFKKNLLLQLLKENDLKKNNEKKAVCCSSNFNTAENLLSSVDTDKKEAHYLEEEVNLKEEKKATGVYSSSKYVKNENTVSSKALEDCSKKSTAVLESEQKKESSNNGFGVSCGSKLSSVCSENIGSTQNETSYFGFVKPRRYIKPKFYTVEEVKKHCLKTDCWVIIDGKVYDVTSWITKHPGGELVIMAVAGMDVTDAFLVNHLPWVRDKLLPLYQIGYVDDYKKTEISNDFCALALQLEKEGWYNTSYSYYLSLIVWYTILFACALFCILYGKTFFTRCLLSSIFLGFFWQQIAFFGHDLGHMAVTHNRTLDNIIGIVGGNLLMGIALGWWKATHNVHHIVTNYLEHDPDIQHLPVLAVSDKFFSGIKSFYHQRKMGFDKVSRVLVRRQHLLFYVVMALARFNLYIQSIILLSSPTKAKERGAKLFYFELFMLSGFYIWFIQVLRVFPTWPQMLIFLFLSHGIAGILHLQICLSHFSMDVLEPKYHGKPLESASFAEHQLNTSLDVSCSPWLDWFHGGLQFQATHHLFPLIPRHSLRKLANTHVKAFCRRHNIIYHELSFWKGNVALIKTLRNTAEKIHPWLLSLSMCEG